MNILDLYQALLPGNENSEIARKVLMQTHWFSVNAVFDPRTGNALPQSLTCFLKRVANSMGRQEHVQPVHDRLWRIVSHCRAAVEHIMFSLNENPQREHAPLPIRAVRELDANSFIKLSSRPGRNVREKLAGKPYLQAVRRYQSVNLPENRLFKAFLIRLLPLLKKRYEIFSEVFQEEKDALVQKIENWLRTDEAQTIARWDNLPPNNTLLSHRDYRRIWDSWTWLQTLDSEIDKDFSSVDSRQITIDFWNRIALLRYNKDLIFAETPVLFEFNTFKIWPLCYSKFFLRTNDSSIIIRDYQIPKIKKTNQPKKDLNIEPVDKPACVDFTRLHPVYAIDNYTRTIPVGLIWQRWSFADQSYDISALQADALFSDDSVKTISSSDLFFSENLDRAEADCAALSIARDLRQIFLEDSLIWLFPDYLSDFELEIIRRNINSSFPYATPLPRSIAAVFQNVDFTQINGSNFSVLIVDVLPGHVSATKLVAKYSEEQKKAIPETKGYAWERHPSVNLDCFGYIESVEYESVDKSGSWKEVKLNIPDKSLIDSKQLKDDPRIGDYSLLIVLSDAPVAGGLRVSELQAKAPGVPLWYDHLPELSTKIPQNGIFDHFYFVKNARVAPKRGVAINIPIANKFTLPPGLKHYEFPLQRGSGDSSLQFVASLKSSMFPLARPTTCSLNMTYTYGADKPYTLTFIPEDESIHPILVEWLPAGRRNTASSELYIPEIPARKNWHDFLHYPKKDGAGESDLLDWIAQKVKLLNLSESAAEKLKKFKNDRVEGTIQRIIIKEDRDPFLFVEVDGEDKDIYCSGAENNIVDGTSLDDVSEGDTVYLNIQEKGNRKFGTKLSFNDLIPSSLNKQFSREKYLQKNEELLQKSIFSLRFPVLTVWNNGHSLSEADVPNTFRKVMIQGIKDAEELLQNSHTPPKLKEELFFFLCCLHKDTAKSIPNMLSDLFNDKKKLDCYFRNIAYAIGDASLKWQQDLLKQTIDFILDDQSNAIAFKILSIVLWRNQEPLEQLSFSTLTSLVNALYNKLKRQTVKLQKLDSDQKIKQYKQFKSAILCKLIELLLVLIRTRKCSNSRIKNLFVPDNSISGDFVDLLDNITKILVEENITLKSRISLQVNKPVTLNKTPDLLYALRMYLTGDSGANSICIDNISEEE